MLLLIIVSIFGGCANEIAERERAMHDFHLSKGKLENVRSYINKNADSICSIFIDKDIITLQFKGDDYGKKRIEIKNLVLNSVLKDSSSFIRIIKYADQLNVTTIAGNEDFAVFSYSNIFSNCFNLYYRVNPYSEIDTACKIGQLFEKKRYWIYLLDSNWYLKKESCL